jgi:hypothetical protein
METKTQGNDLGTRLNEAVLRGALPGVDEGSMVSNEVALKKANKSAFVKGGTPGPGRPKGSVPKTVKTIRDAVLQAFDQVGGAAYLAKLAQGTQSDRAAFVSLVSKVLPTQINANVEGGIQVQLSWLSGRSIGTTASQFAEPVTQVIDLAKDNGGKYRIVDPVAQPEAAAGAVGGSVGGSVGADEVPAHKAAEGAQDA